ncbi:MAG: AAA family ATPase [Bacillota bacterium]|nr:AAA family ATPase [Bacillota bacterium]
MGRSILIASGKGGSGRTTFSISMAITLAKRGSKVCLVDLNFGLRNLDIYMGIEDNVIFDIGDIFAGVCKLEKALVKYPDLAGLYVLEATQNKIIKGITEGHIKALVSRLKKDFDYVIIDGPTAVGVDLGIAAAGADSAVIVLTPDQLSLRNSDAVDRRLNSYGVKSRCFVVNMVRRGLSGQDYGPSLNDMTNVLDIPMAGLIPYDENIEIGNNAGNPVCLKENYISKNIDEIVTRMLG